MTSPRKPRKRFKGVSAVSVIRSEKDREDDEVRRTLRGTGYELVGTVNKTYSRRLYPETVVKSVIRAPLVSVEELLRLGSWPLVSTLS